MNLHRNLLYMAIVAVSVLNVGILSYDSGMINGFTMLTTYFTCMFNPIYLGLHEGVMKGTHFNLDSATIGLNAAIVSAGSIIGSPLVGPISDKYGRKAALMLADGIIIVAGILQITATTEAQFVVGRFLLGLAFVITGSVTPMWVMELAPSRHRNTMVGLMMSGLPVMGILVLAIIAGVVDVPSNWGWRGCILVEVVFSVLGLAIMPWMPESPRWLISKGQDQKALKTLTTLISNGETGNDEVKSEFDSIRSAIVVDSVTSGWKCLFTPWSNFRRFGISVLCNIFFQMCGANTLLYFLAIILASAGIEDTRTVIIVNIGITIWAWLSVMMGTFLVDKLGRRVVFLSGTSLIAVTLAIFAALDALKDRGMSYTIGSIAMLFLFQFGGCACWMILAYSYPVEVLNYSQRAKGVAVAQAVGYGFSFLNLYIIPIAIDNIGWKYYALNAAWCFVFVIVMYFCFIETGGKTLEEINQIFEGLAYTDGICVESSEERQVQVMIDKKEESGGEIC